MDSSEPEEDWEALSWGEEEALARFFPLSAAANLYPKEGWIVCQGVDRV